MVDVEEFMRFREKRGIAMRTRGDFIVEVSSNKRKRGWMLLSSN
jgi:hypothetical protein